MKKSRLLSFCKLVCLAALLLTFSCDKSDSDTYTITIEAYTKDGSGNYIATGKTLIFNSHEECQTWSRTAPGGDAHSEDSHLHYNAAADVSFDNDKTTFSWTEYGPEIDQSSIEATCAAGSDGVTKKVDDSSYYQDKPSLYLKITNVEKL